MPGSVRGRGFEWERARRDRQRVKHRGPDPGMTFEISLCTLAFVLFSRTLFSADCFLEHECLRETRLNLATARGRFQEKAEIFQARHCAEPSSVPGG